MPGLLNAVVQFLGCEKAAHFRTWKIAEDRGVSTETVRKYEILLDACCS
jgi:hypothetical protein